MELTSFWAIYDLQTGCLPNFWHIIPWVRSDPSIQKPKSEVRVLLSDCGSNGKKRQVKLPSPDLTIPVDQGSGANIQINTTNDNRNTQEDIVSISLLIMDGMLSTVCQGANSNSSTEHTSAHSDLSSYSCNESLLVSSVKGVGRGKILSLLFLSFLPRGVYSGWGIVVSLLVRTYVRTYVPKIFDFKWYFWFFGTIISIVLEDF